MTADLASLMADEPQYHPGNEYATIKAVIRNDFRAQVRPLIAELEAREQALLAERDAAEESRRFYMAERDRLLARVAELEAALAPTFHTNHRLQGHEGNWRECINGDCPFNRDLLRATLEGRTE